MIVKKILTASVWRQVWRQETQAKRHGTRHTRTATSQRPKRVSGTAASGLSALSALGALGRPAMAYLMSTHWLTSACPTRVVPLVCRCRPPSLMAAEP
jgi:hypothetical protein